MKRLAATVLSILFLALPALFGAVAQAQEQPGCAWTSTS